MGKNFYAEQNRQKIIKQALLLHKKGLSLRDIAKQMKKSKVTIWHWIKDHSEYLTIQDKKKN